MAQQPDPGVSDPVGKPAADAADAAAAERATDEGMPEEPASAADARAADRAASDAAAIDADADGLHSGRIKPHESDDRRGIEDEPGEQELGGKG